MATPCPVCQTEVRKTESRDDRYFYECLRCGPYSLSGTAKVMLESYLGRANDVAATISYSLYRMTKREQWVMLGSDLIKDIVKHTELPRPPEQLDNLILWLGEKQPNLGADVSLTPDAIAATGTTDSISVGFLISQAIETGLVSGVAERVLSGEYLIPPMQLSMKGWERFEELQRGRSSGRHAFMAMQFGNAKLDKIVDNHFKPAVKATGFDLKRLDDGQPAGLIDDRLRVEIRQSRFLIADLTHQNRGAYWEAGYAEGLGKPVIYTCRKDVFDSKAEGTHFDTNHHLTVVWEPDKLPEAIEKLKATIRSTLPEEAKLSE